VTLTQLEHLRKLLEDDPALQAEAVAGDGAARSFNVGNPPIIAGSVAVAVDGAALSSPAGFTVVEDRTVRLTTAPAATANVVISYSRQTFGDAELEHYLALAQTDWGLTGAAAVYRAGIYALDALLMGSAAALNFETFDMESVHNRMAGMRAVFAAGLAAEAARPALLTPLPVT
jgi:hypothetical protein